MRHTHNSTRPQRAALLLILLMATGCRGPAVSDRPVTPENGRAVEHPALSTTSCGICLAHSYQSRGERGYGTDASQEALERLAEIGVRSISLTPFGYQNAQNGVGIRSSQHHLGGENTAAMAIDARRARQHGMTVMVKPHLWVTGAWRGELMPAAALGGWDAWFVSYTEFILEWARFAEEIDADWFVVGVELKTSSTHSEPWRRLIAAVRQVYSGQITYAANWDEIEQIEFWPELDAVGVQMFAPLAEEGIQPTAASVQAAASRWLEAFRTVANAAGRPLVVTEAGVINREHSLVRPYEWPSNPREESTEEGDLHQRWAYEAIIETFGRDEDVIGIYWWKVFTDLATREEGDVGFSPVKKPAEDVLRAVCRPESL